jgi:hypothetical protein
LEIHMWLIFFYYKYSQIYKRLMTIVTL